MTIPQLAQLPPHIQFMLRLYARGDEQVLNAVTLFMCCQPHHHYSDRQIALSIGAHERTVRRWRADWTRTRDQAREAMLRLGYSDREMTALPQAELVDWSRA